MSKTNKDILIRLQNVWKTYTMGANKVHALRNMNFEAKRGEFVAIMGPSGSGKSTMVNLVGCLDIPTKGEIFLKHQNIAHLSESKLAQIRGQTIGFIFQQFNLIPTISALENVMLPMTFQNMVRSEREKRAAKLLDLVGLGDRLHHRPTELSGGQQQRVAIARSLSNDPELILADEPTGNLDSKTGVNVMSFLEKLNREQGKTIVMVTHDEKLSHIAERVAHLMDGQIINETRPTAKERRQSFLHSGLAPKESSISKKS
ncbi:MAG: ABC transporter ATP-binding protein [DPANN group archaeon]|nr:ABC transporter ATP-binding protein [DPANN group archaeon]